jgi:2-dehydro-3-deoxygluconokinase
MRKIYNAGVKIVTFGEVLMRLSPPGHKRLVQTSDLNVDFGGGEANVAISLAYMGGVKAIHVTQFPDNEIGYAATQYLRKHWIDTSEIVFDGEKIGIYFLEKGAVHRPSFVWYDRNHTSFQLIHKGLFDWESILQDAKWFHWTGNTPALSQGTSDACLEALQTARKFGITVSGDINYRKNMWDYGKTPHEVLPEFIEHTDIVLGGARDLQPYFGVFQPIEMDYKSACKEFISKFPNVRFVSDKTRIAKSASHNIISGHLYEAQTDTMFESPKFEVSPIIDRVGAGDAFDAGIIYGFLNYAENIDRVTYAAAACALKHTIEGDANILNSSIIENLMRGDTSGNLIR